MKRTTKRWAMASLGVAACAVPLFAHAQPEAAPRATPPSVATATATTTPTAAPAASAPPPSASGHWVYVPEPAPSAAPAPPTTTTREIRTDGREMHGPYEKATTWDLNVEGAFGRFYGDNADKWTGFARVRGGVLFIREPFYNSVGITYEFSSLEKATFGIQAEILHLDAGLWAQIGPLIDVSPRLGVMAAVGWSLFGVEAQYRSYENIGAGLGVYAKIRAPISIIARIFKPRVRMVEAPASAPPPK